MQHFPDELNNLKLIKQLSEKIHEGRKTIIKELRDSADKLEKTTFDVLVANRVGGKVMESAMLFFGGLLAAPYTVGLSLGLTMAGATSAFDAISSVGVNIVDNITSKNPLEALEMELKSHHEELQQLSECDSSYLTYTVRFRPIIEQLGKLSDEKWVDLMNTIQTLIALALEGDEPGIERVINCDVDPVVIQILQQVHFPEDNKSLHALDNVCTQILEHIRSITDAIKAFIIYLEKPELARLTMLYTNTSVEAVTETAAVNALEDIAKVLSTLKTYDEDKRKGEPVVKLVEQLRNLADQLENEFDPPTKMTLTNLQQT